MTQRDLLGLAPMLVLLFWAACIDARTRRIPNWLTLALMVTGLIHSLFEGSLVSFGQAWMGLGVGFGLTFILFALGAMGGGDVKLFAGLGAWVGVVGVVQIYAGAAVVGMLIVVYQAARRRRLAVLFRSSAVIALNAAVAGDLSPPPEDSQMDVKQKRLPYAVPTLAATLLVLANGMRRWL